MVTGTIQYQDKSREDLIKELKVLRAQLAVFEETKDACKKAEEETELLKTIILAISEAEDLHSALGIALCKVCEATGWVFGQAFTPAPDEKHLICSPAWYTKIKDIQEFRALSENYKFLPGIGLPGRVWVSKCPAWVKDVTQDSNFPRAPIAKEAGLKAGLAIPILAKEKVIAVIEFFMLESHEEDIHLISLISAVAAQLGNIFERKLAKEALRESETKYRLVAQATNDALWDWDLLTNKSTWNDGVKLLFGYSDEEVEPYDNWWVERLHPDDKSRVIDGIHEIIKSGKENWSDEYRFRCKDDSYAYVTDRGYVIKDETGKSIKMIGGMTDITKIKNVQEKLKNLNGTLENHIESRTNELLITNRELENKIQKENKLMKELRESEEKFRKLIETANDAIFIADTETGIIIDANKKAEELIGYSKDEIIGMHQTQLHPVEESEKYGKLFKEHIDLGKGISEKLLIRHKEGYNIPIEISANVVEIKGKKIIQGIFRNLSNWNQAEETKSQLASIVECSANGIIGITLDGIIISWNPAAQTIYGYTAKEIIGKSVSILTPVNYRKNIPEILERVSKGEIVQLEQMRIKKDGKQIFVSTHLSPIKNSTGQIEAISSIVRDITDQKIAQDNFNEAQRKLSTLINNLSGIAYRCANDSEWTMEYISDGCLELTGYKASEFIKNKVTTYNSIIHIDDRNYVRESIQSTVKKKEPYIIEYRIKTRSGEEKWVWEKGSGVFSTNGELIALEGFITDITDRKNTEKTHSLLACIVDSSSDAIMSKTLDGIITSWNPAAERIYDYTADEIIGKHFTTLIPPELINEAHDMTTKLKNGERIEQFETLRMKKDGTRINVSITLSAIKNTNGEIIGTSTIVRDVTEQRQLQAELEKIRKREQHEREIRSLEALVNQPKKSDITAQLFGLVPLQKSVPGLFNELIQRYKELLGIALNEDLRTKDLVSDELRFICDELCTLKAGPSDVMEIHSIAIKLKGKEINPSCSEAFTEKARLIVLELMGYLVSYYRKHSLVPRSNQSSKTPIKL